VGGAIQFQEHLAHAGRLTAISADSNDVVLQTRTAKLERVLDVQVQTADRAAVADAHVLAMIEKAWLGKRDGRTDESGAIRLAGLAARGFRLEVEPPEGSGLLRRDVHVPAKGSRCAVTLLRGTHLSGRVRFRGVALHGALVSAEVDGEQNRPVRADNQGRFRLGVPADTAHAVVLHVHWIGEYAVRRWTHPLRDRAATDIELDAR